MCIILDLKNERKKVIETTKENIKTTLSFSLITSGKVVFLHQKKKKEKKEC